MSDLIDRQAAIDAFEKELSAKYNRRELAIGFVGIESIIRNLPSVQPNLQPTCNKLATDCIERQSAIDAVRTYYGDDYGITDSIEELIEKLPSVHPDFDAYCDRLWKLAYERGKRDVQPQRWTPVAEALPRDDEDVIVTCLDDSGDTPFRYTTVAWHYKGMWVYNNERCPFVVAWMEKPEPWRGE